MTASMGPRDLKRTLTLNRIVSDFHWPRLENGADFLVLRVFVAPGMEAFGSVLI
jgi:hypothetical protein